MAVPLRAWQTWSWHAGVPRLTPDEVGSRQGPPIECQSRGDPGPRYRAGVASYPSVLCGLGLNALAAICSWCHDGVLLLLGWWFFQREDRPPWHGRRGGFPQVLPLLGERTTEATTLVASNRDEQRWPPPIGRAGAMPDRRSPPALSMGVRRWAARGCASFLARGAPRRHNRRCARLLSAAPNSQLAALRLSSHDRSIGVRFRGSAGRHTGPVALRSDLPEVTRRVEVFADLATEARERASLNLTIQRRFSGSIRSTR